MELQRSDTTEQLSLSLMDEKVSFKSLKTSHKNEKKLMLSNCGVGENF